MRKKIIVGTACMGRLNSAAEIKSLMGKCLDAGFNSFDTAPLYGSGLMESILANSLVDPAASHNGSVNTKFGLYPPLSLSFLDGSYFCKKSAIAFAKRIPGVGGHRRSRNPILETARKSLGKSLRNLGKGRIDVFFAHEIPIAELIAPEFIDFIRDSKRSGKFKRFGLGGYRSQYCSGGNEEFWNCVDVIQVESHSGEPCPRPPGWDGSVFLHGVLSGLKTFGPAAGAANPLGDLLTEAVEIQGADQVVIGFSRERHLLELIDALELIEKR